jgi:hypothetical protein
MPSVYAVGVNPLGGADVITGRADLASTTRGRLGDDQGSLELYADPRSGVLVGAAAVGPDAASWMAEITLAIRAEVPVGTLADVVHAFPGYGEAVEAAVVAISSAAAGVPAALGELTGGARTNKREVSRLSDMDMETPEDDALEQHQEVVDDEEETAGSEPRQIPFDVDEADAAEQERSVGFDDDDYR